MTDALAWVQANPWIVGSAAAVLVFFGWAGSVPKGIKILKGLFSKVLKKNGTVPSPNLGRDKSRIWAINATSYLYGYLPPDVAKEVLELVTPHLFSAHNHGEKDETT